MMAQPVDLSTTFVHLSNGGEAELIELTPAFWRGASGGKRYDRVIGIFAFRSSKDLHSTMQEVHRESDELLYVISGAIDAVLEDGGAERTVALAAGQATIVPRGMWHRLVMRKPGKLLFINTRTGTQSRTSRNKPLPETRAGRSNGKRGRRVSVRARERRR
jgi:mannose-6-phosphate isomerase-like protein (cupin superfamily)